MPASWCSHVWCVLLICLDLTYSDLWESPMLRISSSVVHLLIHPILPGFFIFWWSDHPTICLERLSWGKIVSSRCSSVLLVLLSKWPSLKDVISQIKSSSVWQRWYDTSFLSFDHWYSPWSNRSIISAKSMISYPSCHQEFPGYVNYILNKLILSSF